MWHAGSDVTFYTSDAIKFRGDFFHVYNFFDDDVIRVNDDVIMNPRQSGGISGMWPAAIVEIVYLLAVLLPGRCVGEVVQCNWTFLK